MLGLSFTDYLRFWFTVTLLRVFAWLAVLRARYNRRGMGLVPLDVRVQPDRVLYVPCTYEKHRKIRVEVYEPPSASSDNPPKPVHINLHGSGFVVNLLGTDGEFCYYLSRKLNCVVLDAQYSKAPERPYPCALHDVLSVVAFAQSQSHWLDRDRLTLGGFSAGANLALTASAALPSGDVKAVAAWYPPCDVRHGVREQVPVPPIAGDELPGSGPGHALSEEVLVNVFSRAYIQDADTSDPRINPMCCDPARFPPVTLVASLLALFSSCHRDASHRSALRTHCTPTVWPLTES